MNRVHPRVIRERFKRACIVVGLLVYFCGTYWMILHTRDERIRLSTTSDPVHR